MLSIWKETVYPGQPATWAVPQDAAAIEVLAYDGPLTMRSAQGPVEWPLAHATPLRIASAAPAGDALTFHATREGWQAVRAVAHCTGKPMNCRAHIDLIQLSGRQEQTYVVPLNTEALLLALEGAPEAQLRTVPLEQGGRFYPLYDGRPLDLSGWGVGGQSLYLRLAEDGQQATVRVLRTVPVW